MEKRFPEVYMLRETVLKRKLTFELSTAWPIPDRSFVTVTMKAGKKCFLVPVYDEYRDFDLQKPSMVLHLILIACEDFEEAEDYLVWCNDLGLKAADERCRSAWFHLRDEVPKIRAFLGDKVQPIDSFHYQLGAGGTQLLREIDQQNQ